MGNKHTIKLTEREYNLIKDTIQGKKLSLFTGRWMIDTYPDIPDWRMRAEYYTKRSKNG